MTDAPSPLGRRFDDTFSATARGENELVFTRRFAAPRALVWKALTTAEHIPHWWGPHAARTTVDEMDVRVGGRWRFVCAEDDERHAFRGTYLEIAPYDRLVQTFEYEAVPGTVTETTTLVERDGVTEMTVVSVFPSREDRDGALKHGMAEGSRQSWERMADFLSGLRQRPEGADDLPEARTIRASRSFKAPRERLWDLFENPTDLAAWWGPAGFTNHFETFEFKPGGAWRFVMRDPDGNSYFMNKRFVEVAAPRVIVLDHLDPVHGFRMSLLFHEVPEGTLLEWIMEFDHAAEATKVRPFVEPANEQNLDRLAAHLNAR